MAERRLLTIVGGLLAASGSFVGCATLEDGVAPADDRVETTTPVDDVLYEESPQASPDVTSVTTTVPFLAPVFDNADNNSNAAFNTMMAESGGERYVWRKSEVTVDGSGLGGGRNLEILQEAVGRINSLGYPNVPRLVLVNGSSDVTLHSLEKKRWPEVLGNFTDKPEIDGLTRTLWDDGGALIRATIVVDATSSQWQRNRTIVHELLHSLGLGHHRCPSGILEESATYSPNWTLNSFDLLLIRMQYASPQDLTDLSKNPQPCAEVTWQTITDPERDLDLWCATSGDIRGCIPASATTEPSSEVPPVAWLRGRALVYYDPRLYTRYTYEDADILCKNTPVGESYECSVSVNDAFGEVSLWLRDEVVYDYNPETYIRFRYNGAKILCFKPSGGVRSGCQYTEGNSIDRVDVWTDGEKIYANSQ